MIRFIDLGEQIIQGDRQFAFYDTVKDEFVCFDHSQTWDCVQDFIQDFESHCGRIWGGLGEFDRFLTLIPSGKWPIRSPSKGAFTPHQNLALNNVSGLNKFR